MLSTSPKLVSLRTIDTKPYIVSCLKCGRPISSKESVERGYGPKCWLGHQQKVTTTDY